MQSKEFREILMTKMRNFDFENGNTGFIADFDVLITKYSKFQVEI